MKKVNTIKQFLLKTNFTPAGDQPQAIESLISGLNSGLHHQVLLGVTGSGKTYTVANVIQRVQRPALILVHNKTLAAQLYAEMKQFFPQNCVEYFASYYDYYQPEAYNANSDTYIEKDASVNEHVEQMRLSTTRSIVERKDVIIVATVSAIYGLGDPEQYMQMLLHLKVGETISERGILNQLSNMQYKRNNMDFSRGSFRVRGEVIDIFPADAETHAIRLEIFNQEIVTITLIDSLTGKKMKSLEQTTIFPSTHYVSSKERQKNMVAEIKVELEERINYFQKHNRLVEAQRIEERTRYDIEMINELGYCTGIENYSRLLSGRGEKQPPPTLLDYLPQNTLVIVDESHVTIPQFRGMYKGDRSRKENLVNYGFRLPSALDNRPLMFDEFEKLIFQAIYVSATPAEYEQKHSQKLVEQVVRPTGLLDPTIEVRPASMQVEDALSEIHQATRDNARVLIITLTKRMAEDLSDYLSENNIRVRYLHADIGTVERVEIIRDLRLGVFDVLVGINLLREGLDMPEVSTVLIFDADKEGFLRSEHSLIQTVGRAARNVKGHSILYANTITQSMHKAIEETERRRLKQEQYNKTHGIVPTTIHKRVNNMLDFSPEQQKKQKNKKTQKKITDITPDEILGVKEAVVILKKLERQMKNYARTLEFETASDIRNQIHQIKKNFLL